MTADVDRQAAHRKKFFAWAAAGVVALAAGFAWVLVVSFGSVDWPDFMDPWIGYTRPAVVLAIVGAAACFVRAADNYRSSRA